MKTCSDNIETDVASVSDLSITAVHGMCHGISTAVPNDVELTQIADHLITSKAVARVASVKRARKISLGDL